MGERELEGVLITGVYGSGKSSVAAEVAYLLEQRQQSYALLDLDYLSWAGTARSDRAEEFGLLLHNLADVTRNYRRGGIRRFVLAYFVRAAAEVRALRQAAGMLVHVARQEPSRRRGAQPLGSELAGAARREPHVGSWT